MRLQRYVLVEFLRSLGLAVAVFVGLTLTQTMIRIAKMEDLGADLFSIFPAVPYFLPHLLSYSLPMAFLVSCILTFGRLASSGEIAAMKAAGVRVSYLGSPVIAAALLSCPLLLFLCDRGISWGFSRAREKIVSLARESLRRGFVPGRVFRVAGGRRSCSVALLDGGGVHLVIFEDGKRMETLEARRCTLTLVEGEEAHLLKFSLRDGVRVRDFSRPILFDEASLELEVPGKVREKLPLGGDASTRGIGDNLARVREMTLELASARGGERRRLQREIEKAYSSVEQRLAIALAPLAFVLFGIPLGLRSGRGTRTAAFLIGMLVIFGFYYPLWAAGQVLAVDGHIPHALGAWLPNALLGGAGAVWLARWAD